MPPSASQVRRSSLQDRLSLLSQLLGFQPSPFTDALVMVVVVVVVCSSICGLLDGTSFATSPWPGLRFCTIVEFV